MLQKTFIRTVMSIFALPFILSAQMTKLELFTDHITYKDPSVNRYITDINVHIVQEQIRKLEYFSLDTIEIICEIKGSQGKSTKGWHCFSLNELKKNDSFKDILDVFTVALKNGDYTYDVKVYPRNREVPIFGVTKHSFTVKKYSDIQVENSDILISSLISRPQANSDLFIKSGLLVQPYPERQYTIEQPLLYYYWEVYNLNASIADQYKVQAQINNENGLIKKLKPPQQIFKKDKAIFLAGQNIIALKDGDYKLVLKVFENEKLVTRQEADINMYKKAKIAETIDDDILKQVDSVFLAMTEEEIDDEIKTLKYIMKENTYKQTCAMNLISKKASLTQFWKANDYIKDTGQNEFRQHYQEKVKYVRDYFTDDNLNVDGVDTDMGRVILLFGKPDVINREVDDDMAGRGVELWKMHQYQAVFLFVQENFIGPYILVHSTMKGEIRNPKWATYLEANPDLINF